MYNSYIFYLNCNIWNNYKDIYEDNQFITSTDSSFRIVPPLNICINKKMTEHKNKKTNQCKNCSSKRCNCYSAALNYKTSVKCNHMSRVGKKKSKKNYIKCKIIINEMFKKYYNLNYILVNDENYVLFPRKIKDGKYYFKIKRNVHNIYFSFLKNTDKYPESDLNDFEPDFPFIYLFINVKKK